MIKTAYACSPLIPETDEKIDSIVIKSTKDFNENYPSGSDLADLFNVSHNPPAGTSLTAISRQVAGPGGSFALATPSRREPFRYRYGGQIHAKVAIQRKPGAA